MSSSSQAESPCVISLDDGDSNNSCIITEAPSTPKPPPIRFMKDKRPQVIPWGEFDSVPEEEDDPITLAVMKDVKRKSVLSVAETLETEDEQSIYVLFPPHLYELDERVLHSIRLQEYIRNIDTMIEDIKAGENTDESNPYPPVPKIPCPNKVIPHRTSCFPNIRMERDPTNFAVGKPSPDLDLPITAARCLLEKSVETLLAHHTYTDASELAFNVLVGVVDKVMTNLSIRLRIAADQEDMTGDCGFHSVTERALTETNLGSLAEVIRYYQTNIIGVQNKLERRCARHQITYANLVKCKIEGLVEQAEQVDVTVPMDEEEYEEEEDEEDVPEIHFPALDEDDQLGLQPSLETGFQMLDSLEHDESLQNLDPDEEINVDSPSQEFMLSVISELSNTLDFSKGKKRKKKLS